MVQPLKGNEISGNWATVLLPINEDESIDFARLDSELDILISVQPDGMYSNGTAGEFYNITEAEFDRIADMLAAKCNTAGIPFQIGVSHMSPVLSLERLKRVVHLQPGAVQVILPDWFKTTDEEAFDFLDRMADAAGDIGLVLYNPPHSKRVLSPEELLRITRQVPQLVGVKVADGDDGWYHNMKAVAGEISVFIPGHKIASAYRKGVGHGAYSNMACLNPKAAQQWSDQVRADIDAALELEQRVLKFLDLYIAPFILQERYANQAVDKLLAAIGNWAGIGARLRWPYRSIADREAVRLRPIARDLLPEFFVDV